MSLMQFWTAVVWDFRVNRGWSFDSLRAKLFLLELRIEQVLYGLLAGSRRPLSWVWVLVRGLGSVVQWFLCHSNIPGSTRIGRGLRLPHPSNIIIAGYADIGEFCTIYHNVSVAWNGFQQTRPGSPKIGSRVLLGAGSIVVGEVEIGSDVLIGAGAIVSKPVPSRTRVVSQPATMSALVFTPARVEPGSRQHLKDPYGIWR
jgi:serine acetyltransferase